jgi:hypothetical protein
MSNTALSLLIKYNKSDPLLLAYTSDPSYKEGELKRSHLENERLIEEYKKNKKKKNKTNK